MSADSAPTTQAGMVSELPEPGINTANHAHVRIVGYTADQMRAYAQAALNARGRLGVVRAGEVFRHDGLTYCAACSQEMPHPEDAPDYDEFPAGEFPPCANVGPLV